MAKTYPKLTLRVRSPGDSEMSYWIRKLPETASSTFIASAPLVYTAGLTIEGASPAVFVYGFALRAGRNGSSDRDYWSELVVNFPGLEFYASFLSADGTGTNAITAADMMNANPLDIEKNAVGAGASVIWHVADASVGNSCNMIAWDSDYIFPNLVQNTYADIGDLNARVTFQVHAAINSYIGLSG